MVTATVREENSEFCIAAAPATRTAGILTWLVFCSDVHLFRSFSKLCYLLTASTVATSEDNTKTRSGPRKRRFMETEEDVDYSNLLGYRVIDDSCIYYLSGSFSSVLLALLVERQEGHPTCKNNEFIAGKKTFPNSGVTRRL